MIKKGKHVCLYSFPQLICQKSCRDDDRVFRLIPVVKLLHNTLRRDGEVDMATTLWALPADALREKEILLGCFLEASLQGTIAYRLFDTFHSGKTLKHALYTQDKNPVYKKS